MIEKHKLLEKIDEAIKDVATSPKNKELLKKIRPELTEAKDKSKYLDIALKLANILGALAKVFSGSG